MKSVRCQCTLRQFVEMTWPTILIVAGLTVLLKLAGHAGWLPPSPVAADPDETVLAHQALASRQGPPAEIVLAGDSTCLAGVDAAGLSRQLEGRPRVLSLAMFIWLDMGVYGQAVSNFAAAHPGHVRTVVLLVSPAKLANPGGDGSGWDVWRQVQPEQRRHDPYPAGVPADWLGAGLLRRHLLSYCLATPLHGSGAEFFGFSSEIDRYMTDHSGSLLTLGSSVIPRGAARPIWTASPSLETECRNFKAGMPSGARLFLGLTPGPESTAVAGPWRQELLRQWNTWIDADGLLTNLPPALPDVFFSGGGHLNEQGQRRFTSALARELSPCLQPH